MLARPLALAVAAVLVPAAPAAAAGPPILPLDQVRAGMRCTAATVIRGTEPSTFDVEVLDVVDGDTTGEGARILARVSGPAVDATGVAQGFSGSPVSCPDAQGVPRIAGALSESVGQYGDAVVLATPIETILGTPVHPPAGPRAAAARRHALPADVRPLPAPLTVAGVGPRLGRALVAAGARAGRTVLVPPDTAPPPYPVQTLRPGASVAVGYSSGDLRLGGVGTVSYADGSRVWAFGHEFEGGGRRALLLQDAYVYGVVANPLNLEGLTSYKLAAIGHPVGTLSSDGLSAVAGTVGALPHTAALRVTARDVDAGHARTLRAQVADEMAVDLPGGSSPLSTVAPLGVVEAAERALDATPVRLTGSMCLRIDLRERAPMRACNRYVSAGGTPSEGGMGNAVLGGAAQDVATALGFLDAYTGPPPHVTGVAVRLTLHRGARQAFLGRVHAPRRVRAGERVRLRVRLHLLRGPTVTRTYALRIPRDLRPGRRVLRLVGQDADTGDGSYLYDLLDEGDGVDATAGHRGAMDLAAVARQVARISRYDGVTLEAGGVRRRGFRDPRLRLSGTAQVALRVVR
jgi:hypothetical protein